jgi:hypothetical protein
MQRLAVLVVSYFALCAHAHAEGQITDPAQNAQWAIPGTHTCSGDGFEPFTTYRIRLVYKHTDASDDVSTWTQITSDMESTDDDGAFTITGFGSSSFNVGVPAKEARILVDRYVNPGGWTPNPPVSQSITVIGFQSGPP